MGFVVVFFPNVVKLVLGFWSIFLECQNKNIGHFVWMLFLRSIPNNPMYVKFEGCIKTLWQLDWVGDQTIKKGEFPTKIQHKTFSHLVMISTLIFSTSFGIN